MTDVVIPYDAGELFFLDGAPIKATDLDRLKILIEGPGFQTAFAMLNWNLRTGDVKRREMYSKQYHAFIEALLREHCTDVTSQVVSAFRTAIKPRLKDRLPDNKVLRKRPKFPSGAESRLGLRLVSWFRQRDWERNVVFAGGDRLQRSVGS